MVNKIMKKVKIIISIFIVICALALRMPVVKAEDDVQETPEKTYEAQIELNTISSKDDEKIEGSKLKITDITENSSAVIKIFNTLSGEEIIIAQDDTFTTGSQGVIVDLSNLIKEKKYQIRIENLQATEGYQVLLKSLVLEVSIDENENIKAQILEIIDENENNLNPLNQVIARLRGINSEGIATINPSQTDETVTYKYRVGENGRWNDYKEEIKIYQNTTVYAKATKNGINSGVSLKIINNIDKVQPQLASYTETNETQGRYSKITATLTDDASGIEKYGISTSNTEEPDEYINADKALSVEATIDKIYENGTHYMWIWDVAGNCAKEEINIEKVEYAIVARITASTQADLIGSEYIRLADAINACPQGTEASSTILIVNEIYNENNTIENRNLTINLYGNTITNKSSSAPAITINENSNLTIINEGENGTALNNGSITSKNSTGIQVKENATLTLGKNDRRIRVAQPAISGKTNGVVNQGTFNFYDGNVTATIPDPTSPVLAIYGRVTDTPIAYSVGTKNTKTETESIQVANPAVIDGIEARIGRKTYTKLETAIEEAGTVFGTDGSQVEITIVTDLNKEDTVVIDGSKNIKLDLNGYSYTTKSSGYVIENYGELEIVDTSEEKTGEIVGTTNSAVHNMTHDIKGEVNEVDLSTVECHASTGGWGRMYRFYLTEDGLRAEGGDAYYNGNPWGDIEIDLTEYEGKQCVINVDAETVTENYQTYRRYF